MAKEKKTVQTVQPKALEAHYKLMGIDVPNFSMSVLNFPTAPQSTFSFEIALQNRVNVESSAVMIKVSVVVSLEDNTEQFASIEVICAFEVMNFSEIIIAKNDGSFDIPDGILSSFNNIAIGATRGVMVGYFRGTPLHKAILPVMRLQDFKIEK